MKKTVPFTKEIDFKTMISKMTSISLEHTLKPGDNNIISGYFIIEGKYKMTLASQIDEDFSYKIPVDIDIDKKYDISNVEIDIEDFTYEIVDEEKLFLNITVSIDNIEELHTEIDDKIEVINTGDREDNSETDLFLDKFEEHELEIIPEDYNENNEEIPEDNNDSCYEEELPVETDVKKISNDTNSGSVNSLFSSFKDSAETFKTYSVYIIKEEDTLNSILDKYNIDKESLEEYNDLSKLIPGNKIIIPSLKNE